MTQHEALGWVILVGVPLLLVIWIISVIPPEVWIVLALVVVALVFAFLLIVLFARIGAKGEASAQKAIPLREVWAEAKRKTRVQALQQEVPRLKRQLADAERELRSLWREGDG